MSNSDTSLSEEARLACPNPTDADRIGALDWLVREANTKQVWIAQGCYCFIGIGRKQLVEGDDLTDALDALVALREDTADVL